MKAVYTLAAVVGLILGGTAPAGAQAEGKKELVDILEGVGCKDISSVKGTTGNVFYAEYTANRKTYHLRACLSEDKSQVWISLPLTKVGRAAAAANADALYTLLERTNGIGPRHFKISGGMLYLSGAIENRDVTDRRVQEMIKALVDDLEKTRRDWDFDWSKPAAAPAQQVGG